MINAAVVANLISRRFGDIVLCPSYAVGSRSVGVAVAVLVDLIDTVVVEIRIDKRGGRYESNYLTFW